MAGGLERSLQPLLTLLRKAYMAIFVYPPKIENPPLTHARLGFQRQSSNQDGRAGATFVTLWIADQRELAHRRPSQSATL